MITTGDRSSSPRLDAVRDVTPIVLAYLPFGLALGATLAATRVSPSIAWSSSPLLFGGAAQLVSVQLLDTGANVIVVVLAALVVNARMLLYSAALAPHTAGLAGALAVGRCLLLGRSGLRLGHHPLRRAERNRSCS